MANVSTKDRDIVRALAERRARAAESRENLERRELWYRHDAGERTRPLVLAEVGGVMNEALPDTTLACTGDWARGVERRLRVELYEHEVLRDDHVIEPFLSLNWKVEVTPFVDQSEIHVRRADNAGQLGARAWDAPIRDLRRDFGKLRRREFSVDREATCREKAELEKLFEGILPVRIRGSFYWTMGMTWNAIDLIGLEGLMLFMYDDPDGLHRLMEYLCDEHLRFAEWLEAEKLYSMNNENDYIGSGSMGYTRSLSTRGAKGSSSGAVRSKDLWVLLESQETVGVGPEQFAEFIFPYQLRIAKRFGRCYYGCCEPVHTRWHVLEGLPNLERVSVSPWADEPVLAKKLGMRYVYSRKPAPSLISTAVFDEAEVRRDIRTTLDVARDCRVELIMKDVHTLAGEPQRLARWVRIAREETGA